MKKSIVIPVVVLGIALGAAAIIWTQTTYMQDTFGHSAAANSGSSHTVTGVKATSPGTSNNASSPSDSGNNSSSDANSGSSAADPAEPAGAQTEFQQFMHDSAASRTTVEKGGISYVTNATSPLVLVNKKRELASDYVPDDLIKAPVEFSFSGDSPKQQMRKVAAEALGKLFEGAKKDGIELKAVSGYRSYPSQKSIFNAYAKTHGEEEANTFSAHPGQSEHQTGLAMDVSSASVHYGLEESYGETKEGKWLKAHAADYGFIIRYEKGKETETGYMYEPWHVRYVGVFVAKDVKKLGLTLEAYLARF
ncbi:D-alanyl-D-alanine carboxypeptidase [Paenibacillus sacheonensis]|nr:M15 family metallopeptidase [Paenibacillus sacheonensis]MBM7568260.1 D-alanyl-D-alanine carboxypeptidase [Paenibacillus sacheonensis]